MAHHPRMLRASWRRSLLEANNASSFERRSIFSHAIPTNDDHPSTSSPYLSSIPSMQEDLAQNTTTFDMHANNPVTRAHERDGISPWEIIAMVGGIMVFFATLLYLWNESTSKHTNETARRDDTPTSSSMIQNSPCHFFEWVRLHVHGYYTRGPAYCNADDGISLASRQSSDTGTIVPTRQVRNHDTETSEKRLDPTDQDGTTEVTVPIIIMDLEEEDSNPCTSQYLPHLGQSSLQRAFYNLDGNYVMEEEKKGLQVVDIETVDSRLSSCWDQEESHSSSSCRTDASSSEDDDDDDGDKSSSSRTFDEHLLFLQHHGNNDTGERDDPVDAERTTDDDNDVRVPTFCSSSASSTISNVSDASSTLNAKPLGTYLEKDKYAAVSFQNIELKNIQGFDEHGFRIV